MDKVEKDIPSEVWLCPLCDLFYPTRQKLSLHMVRYHKMTVNHVDWLIETKKYSQRYRRSLGQDT